MSNSYNNNDGGGRSDELRRAIQALADARDRIDILEDRVVLLGGDLDGPPRLRDETVRAHARIDIMNEQRRTDDNDGFGGKTRGIARVTDALNKLAIGRMLVIGFFLFTTLMLWPGGLGLQRGFVAEAGYQMARYIGARADAYESQAALNRARVENPEAFRDGVEVVVPVDSIP